MTTEYQVERAYKTLLMRAKEYGISVTHKVGTGVGFTRAFQRLEVTMIDTFRATSENFSEVVRWICNIERDILDRALENMEKETNKGDVQ